MNILKRHIVFMLTTVFMVGFMLVGTQCSQQVKRSVEQKTIKVGYLPIISSLSIHIAQDNGYFEDEKLKVELIEFRDSNKLGDALAIGTLDVAPTVALVPMANLESRFPGRIRIFSVSKMTKDYPFDSILIKEKLQIQSLKDLEGRKIATFPGTTAAVLLKHFLELQNVDTSKISIVPLSPENQLQALNSGSIDALHGYEPIVSIGLSKGFKRLYGSIYAYLNDPAPIGCSAIAKKFEKDNPKEAASFLKAFDKAVLFVRANPQKSQEVLVRRLNLPNCSKMQLSRSQFDYRRHE